jgi:CRP-like cAMP-binding protein
MKLSKKEIEDLISRFYPSIKENEIKTLLSISRYEVFGNKEIILKSGRTDKTVFIILKGSARAYSLNTKGIEINHHLRSDGFLFGDPEVFGNGVQVLNVEAMSEIHILKFDMGELESIARENPGMMDFYLNLLKEVILTFSHRISTFVSMSPKERYLDLLKWNPLYLESTYDKHIASFLGVSPLTINRVKKKIKN